MKTILLGIFLIITQVFAGPGKKQGGAKNPIELPIVEITPQKPLVYRPAQKKVWDLLHTELHLKPNFQARQITGRAILLLTPYNLPQNKLVLDAVNFSDVKVGVWSKGARIPVPSTYDLYELSIELPATYVPGDTLTVDIDYITNTYTLRENGVDIGEDRGAYFIDPYDKNPYKPMQLWTQGETRFSRAWFPTIDAPNERTSQEVFVTVPNKYISLSNGALVKSTLNSDSTRTDHWKQGPDHPPYLFMLAAGEFVKVSDAPWRGKPIDYYTIEGFEKDVKLVFEKTDDMLEFYSSKLGVDYPWEKYSQIIAYDYTSGAMENTSASLFYEPLYATRQDLIDRNWNEIISHEIFHQWFGNIVTAESWANIAVNESLADYGEYLWYEHANSPYRAAYKLWNNRFLYLNNPDNAEEPIINYYYDAPEDMFDNIRYEKGGLILHMLRHYIGDQFFFAGLKKYLTDNAYNSAEIDHLRLAFEEVTGEDLNWFFMQWFFTKGHPVLSVNTSYDAAKKEVRIDVVQEQVSKGNIAFQFPLAIDIYTSMGAKRQHVKVNQEKHTFYFSSGEAPEFVNIDAEKILLLEKKENKTISQWGVQYRKAPLFADKMEALEAVKNLRDNDKKLANAIFAEAARDTFYLLRRFSVRNLDPDELPETVEYLVTLANTDPFPDVRESAINQLAGLDRKKYLGLMEEIVQRDSSPMVLATCLYQIQLADAKLALQYAARFDSTRNTGLLHALGRLYAKNAGPDKKWVMDKILWVSPAPRVEPNFNNYFEFIKRQSVEVFAKGVQVLSDINRYEESGYVVATAANILNKLVKYAEEKLNDENVKDSVKAEWQAKKNILSQIDVKSP